MMTNSFSLFSIRIVCKCYKSKFAYFRFFLWHADSLIYEQTNFFDLVSFNLSSSIVVACDSVREVVEQEREL